MTDHDPSPDYPHVGDPDCPKTKVSSRVCECLMIARVRADERERHHDGGDCECTTVYADGTWLHASRNAHAEQVAARLVEVICEQAAEWETVVGEWQDSWVDALARVEAERDAARAEAQRFSAEINRMVRELSSIRMEHDAEVAALREQHPPIVLNMVEEIHRREDAEAGVLADLRAAVEALFVRCTDDPTRGEELADFVRRDAVLALIAGADQ